MGANPNIFAGKLTPLMIASYRDSLNILKLLIEYKADVIVSNE
jgi:ankyrin repeat protein